MKAKLLLTLFLFISTFVSAQDNKKEIEVQFMNYMSAIISKDFDKAMNYAPDELFEIMPRDQFISVMEKVFNDPQIEMHIKDPKILSIGEVEEIKGKHYAFMTYSNILTMKFDNSDAESDEEKKMRVEIIKQTFAQAIGEGKVKFNEQTEVFDIYSEKNVYAISKDGKTDWRFIVLEEKQKPFLDKFLPRQLIRKLDFSKN